MSEWSEAIAKVEAIHRGACALASAYTVDTPEVRARLIEQSAALYRLAEDAVLGPLAEDK